MIIQIILVLLVKLIENRFTVLKIRSENNETHETPEPCIFQQNRCQKL